MINVNNVHSISWEELQKWLVETVDAVQVPFGSRSTTDAMTRCDELVGYFANIYSTITSFESAISYRAENIKIASTEKWKEHLRRKDALERAAESAKLKWQAASRMMTAYIESENKFSRVNPQSRGWPES